MISTVTPATISILTTTAAAGLLKVIGIVTLALLLIQKELASPKEDHLGQRLSRVFDIGIAPLLIAFVLVIAFEIAAYLN
jgi:hypothetical protein